MFDILSKVKAQDLGLGTDASASYNWDSFRTLIGNVTQIALTIAGGLAVIYLIIGSIQYFTAYGSEEKATAAKNTILYAIIGVIIITLGKVIIGLVWTFNTPLTLPNFLF